MSGLFVWFSRFRDYSQDLVPQRTEPVVRNGEQTQWTQTVLDEAEWLARPDLWGTTRLGGTKTALAEYYSVTWLLENVIRCSLCAPHIRALWPSGSFDTSILQTGEWLEYGQGVPEVVHRLDAVAGRCNCNGTSVYRLGRQYARGVITADELLNRTWEALWRAIESLPRSSGTEYPRFRREAWEYGRQLALELCGPNPFRPVVFDPRWRTEHTVGIAAKMYDDRDFAAMPILADALEEAGCDSEPILTHCREPGVHVRGCWVVDLVLGKG